VTYIVGDLVDNHVRDEAVAPGTVGIIHLAALTSVLRSVEQPRQTYADNVAVTQELLELARVRGVSTFLLASTNAVVGDVGTAMITEHLPLRPLTPYGATKAACEMLLSGYAGAYGMATCALRFSNVYGPGMAHKDSFVPRLMRTALAGSTVQIYGDGTQRRDLVHIDDVVRGVLLCWETRYSGSVIIGSGLSVSVLELVEAVRRATGRSLRTEHVAAQQGEMPAVVLDLSHSADVIGYRPAVDLADGLASTWRYFRDEVGSVTA
jgi:UDP-glucose 4-epimerase